MTTIGVVAYYIATKEMPFKAKTKEMEKQRVELCDYSWKINESIDGYDECQQNFIISLLQLDPRVRPTAEEMLEDPWLRDVVIPVTEEQDIETVVTISPISTAPNTPNRARTSTGVISESEYSFNSRNTVSTNGTSTDDMETIIIEVPPGFENTAVEMGAVKCGTSWHLTSNAFRTMKIEEENCNAIQIIDMLFNRKESMGASSILW